MIYLVKKIVSELLLVQPDKQPDKIVVDLGSSFDYAFVYGRHPELDIAGIPLNSHDLKRFDNEDERGWYAYDQLRKTGSNDRREDRPNMYYAIKNPDGEDLYPTATAGYDSCWRVERKTYDKLVEDDYILWQKNHSKRGRSLVAIC